MTWYRPNVPTFSSSLKKILSLLSSSFSYDCPIRYYDVFYIQPSK
jgi:hypothetical protein